MSNELTNLRWAYSLDEATEDKRGIRTATERGMAREVVGFDGGFEGGLSPFAGFRLITTLNEYGASSIADDLTMTGRGAVTFRVNANTYAYGIVYRVTRTPSLGTPKSQYHFRIRIGSSTSWKNTAQFGAGYGTQGLLAADEDYDESQRMTVVVAGRFVYVLRRGLRPFMFYLRDDGGGIYTLVVVENTGPGAQPVLEAPATATFSAHERADLGPGVSHPDMAEAFDTPAVPSGTGHADAEARIGYAGFSGIKIVKTPPSPTPDTTNPNLPVRNVASYSDACVGPSECRDDTDTLLWTTPPQSNPSFLDFVPAGSSTTYTAPTEWEGYGYTSTPPLTPRGITAFQNYVWAYQLYDSRTGRLSSLSAVVGAGDQTYAVAAAAQNNDGTGRAVTFPFVEVIYDSNKYDTMYLYRGVQGAGVTADQVILSLENTLTLSDYHIDTQPSAPDDEWKVAVYFTTLDDSELALQPKFDGNDSYLTEPPFAGSGIFVEGVMYYGDIAELDQQIVTLGSVRYSQLVGGSQPELVPPLNRYPLKTPDEEVLVFAEAGQNVFGLTRRGVYLFRRFNGDVQGFSTARRYGVSGRYACCVVGSDIYYVTDKGIKILHPNGALSSVPALDYLIRREWRGELTNVQMAYDETIGAVFVFNPSQEHCAILWTETSRITELHDCTFLHVVEGNLPFDESLSGSPLEGRAIFIQEIKTGVGSPDIPVWRVFVVDDRNAKAKRSLLDLTGSLRFNVTNRSGGAFTLDAGGPSIAEKSYFYVLDGAYAGSKFRVSSVSGATVNVDSAIPLGFPTSGFRIGFSPVYCRWVGYQMGMKLPGDLDSAKKDLARHVQANQMTCTFSEVADGTSSSSDPKFWVSAYRGDESTVVSGRRCPVALNGTVVASIKEGPGLVPANFAPSGQDSGGVQGAALFPVVETFCPEVSYTLIQADVTGNLLALREGDRVETSS